MRAPARPGSGYGRDQLGIYIGKNRTEDHRWLRFHITVEDVLLVRGVKFNCPGDHSDDNSRGFTLLELVIVMAVIGILLVTLGISIGDTSDNTRISSATHRGLADIRYAQEMAITYQREVDVFVMMGADKYEVKWHDTGSHVPSSLNDDDLIVNFNQGVYNGVSITDSEVGGRLSFNSTGAAFLDGGSFGSEIRAMVLNSKTEIIVYPSGYVTLNLIEGGGGCGC